MAVSANGGFHPINLDDYEATAKERLTTQAHGYFSSGANDQWTLRENREAFNRIRLRPRVLNDVSKVNLNTSILGHTSTMPVLVAPTGMQKLAHPEGETATARAAREVGVPMTLSTMSTTPLEEVAESSGKGLRFFQLYVFQQRELTVQLIKRAEAAGYSAIVLTVDVPAMGRREADLRNHFTLPPHLTLANFDEETHGATRLCGAREAARDGSGGDFGLADTKSALSAYVNSMYDGSLTWKTIDWLKSITALPVIVKGIMTPEDALLAREHGVSAIWVSNHGGRQLDGVDAPITVLPSIKQALAEKPVMESHFRMPTRMAIWVDGGVRRGSDILKALALGADMVAVGRPVLWGLACGGQQGVVDVLSMIREELTLAMKLAGCNDVKKVSRQLVRLAHEPV
ncbi:unnamed protein product [Vitrella brassicaformis CCMP3155]|uniref:FMN hydroxy acid dehydrogenase domain-containing protein n=3 Tax=Vitrella brassicaformis TaxID=1169539 RepID=A0A0G4EML4_VITBC|nr:2-hydroxy-acid oxidase [Vitrella brassicaformis]CEL98219.1 unnamed protein product [Vitrella brassicaformis CCMP3155]|mmetsp:Transcript_21070/g.60171  ORF Transcript_21070/g.60171 Transcript_21070/m.60171 type:complete len:401 (-) Transcript_21070:1512-2714(-)|eukprot:CEL98219.1 unnamed protein product [Vitrella brassicaformis CCMP3155]